MLPKRFDFEEYETKISDAWIESGAFEAPMGQRADGKNYSIVIPPPNVTGVLHIGHALNITLQDVLVRYHRMRGYDVLWQSGVDHAGIATQMVVERNLAQLGLPSRLQLGREKFLEHVWRWKDESGDTIINQMKRIGASCDWSRPRFTMDPDMSQAVMTAFVGLRAKGLIYRDKRLVNWDPKFQTAISDLEVRQQEMDGHLWHFRYPLLDDDGKQAPGEYIVVATTRPETMFGDTGVAVHPQDERYRHLVGKFVELPLAGRKIRIVADEHADPELGSGAVKITPAHDFNDFEVGKRRGLPTLNIFNFDITLNDEVPLEFRGLNRVEARQLVLQRMEEAGLIEKVEEHRHAVPHGDRSGEIIEPLLTTQWFVDASKLAVQAMKVVRDGEVRILPDAQERAFFRWMENIQPWCISRQLWWGHRIPAWYSPTGDIIVAATEEQAKALAREKYGEDVELVQDEDVLDTWFSSALWPMSTLGWRAQDPAFEKYYPTSVLVTAFDILFFWVARMIMFGTEFAGQVPFREVYIHQLVRDEKGAKMSKTSGNVIDPLDLIDRYGADSVRLALTSSMVHGRDIRVAESSVELARRFVTKLWNAARLLEINNAFQTSDVDEPHSDAPHLLDVSRARLHINRWLIAEFDHTLERVNGAIGTYALGEATSVAQRFVWNVFCDWWIEMAKVVLTSDASDEDKAETLATGRWCFEQVLLLLHPFAPYVTEVLASEVLFKSSSNQSSHDEDSNTTGLRSDASPGRVRKMLATSEWPSLGGQDAKLIAADRRNVELAIQVITAIRSLKSEMNLPDSATMTLEYNPADVQGDFASIYGIILRLARVSAIEAVSERSAGALELLVGSGTGGKTSLDDGRFAANMGLRIDAGFDVEVEIGRLKKRRDATGNDLALLEKRLANQEYLAKAPAAVVESCKRQRDEADTLLAHLTSVLAKLEAML